MTTAGERAPLITTLATTPRLRAVRHGWPDAEPRAWRAGTGALAGEAGYENAKYRTRVVFMPTRNGGDWIDRGREWFGGT